MVSEIRAAIRESVAAQTPLHCGDEYVALQGLRVLMVDDNEDSCELVATLFNLYRADMTTCCSVKEVLDHFRVLQPQVLLSDIGLPQQDGYVVIQAIRSLSKEQGGQIPAIAILVR